jgi:type II secretory pathway pseudopilin PulG
MRILVSRGGQQLGPFSLDELRGALASGQVSHQDLAWWEGAPSWVPVSQVAGLNVAGGSMPQFAGATVSTQDPASGLSTTSLVLGILSLIGFSCLTGIPAVICGHMALARQRQVGVKRSGVAVAGLVTGYLSIALITLIAVIGLVGAVTVPGVVRARERANLTASMNNAKAIVAACKMYQMEHNNEFPDSLDDLGKFAPPDSVFVDPLAKGLGPAGYWYSKPAKDAPSNEVVVASRAKTHDGERALGHKDGSASKGAFILPLER